MVDAWPVVSLCSHARRCNLNSSIGIMAGWRRGPVSHMFPILSKCDEPSDVARLCRLQLRGWGATNRKNFASVPQDAVLWMWCLFTLIRTVYINFTYFVDFASLNDCVSSLITWHECMNALTLLPPPSAGGIAATDSLDVWWERIK